MQSGTGKSQKESVIAFVGGFQRLEIGSAGIAPVGIFSRAPRENGELVDLFNDNVSQKTAVPAVAICKEMDAHLFDERCNYYAMIKYVNIKKVICKII